MPLETITLEQPQNATIISEQNEIAEIVQRNPELGDILVRLYDVLEHPGDVWALTLTNAIGELFDKYTNGYIRVLEEGAGIGAYVGVLPDSLKRRCSWIQIDFNLGYKKITQEGNSHMLDGYCIMPVDKLTFSDGMFDVVTDLNCFNVVRDLNTTFKEASRVLRDGGILISFTLAVVAQKGTANQLIPYD